MKRNIIYLVLFAIFFTACDKKAEYEVEKSKVVDIAGEWFLTWYIDGTPIAATTVLTYNASADDGTEMWIDDQGDFWPFKVKAKTNGNSLTFGGPEEVFNTSTLNNMIFNNAQIFPDASLQPSGAYTDSMYFEVSFDDDGYTDDDGNWVPDPYGTIYQGAGFRRSGFLEDEH